MCQITAMINVLNQDFNKACEMYKLFLTQSNNIIDQKESI